MTVDCWGLKLQQTNLRWEILWDEFVCLLFWRYSLTLWPRLSLNLWQSSCLSILSAEITNVWHHTPLKFFNGWWQTWASFPVSSCSSGLVPYFSHCFLSSCAIFLLYEDTLCTKEALNLGHMLSFVFDLIIVFITMLLSAQHVQGPEFNFQQCLPKLTW